MLKSLNFTIIKCTECQETIKIQPSVPFESITHECKKPAPKQEVKVEAKAEDKPKRTRKPKAD